jgi:hypothetical protein
MWKIAAIVSSLNLHPHALHFGHRIHPHFRQSSVSVDRNRSPQLKQYTSGVAKKIKKFSINRESGIRFLSAASFALLSTWLSTVTVSLALAPYLLIFIHMNTYLCVFKACDGALSNVIVEPIYSIHNFNDCFCTS